jgi:NAD(P)-dependent dehydrogenase (short-subunit alcohol dehydrogenase family)
MAQSSPEPIERFLDGIPMRGEPEEIGELVLFIALTPAPFVTAETVYVNGGGGWR